MKKHNVVGASAVTLCAALGTPCAFAGSSTSRVLSVPIVADYNAALVKAAGDVVTVNAGLAIYRMPNSGGGSLEINSRFTVTLPAGFSFSSQLALTASNDMTTFALASGGIGAQSATFIVGKAAIVDKEAVTLGSFAVQGVSALETPIPLVNALPISVQSTNNSEITNNDPAPLTKPAFASAPGVKAQFVGAIQFLDLTSPVLGTEFGTSPSQDTTTAVLSAIALSAEENDPESGTLILQPSGAPNALSTADTATVTISGLFNGISVAFANTTPGGDDCQTTTGLGTATGSTLTFPDVPFNREVFFCVTSNGTTLLAENPSGFNPTVAPGTSTDFLGLACESTVCNEFPGLWTYFGGGVLSVTNFFTGDDAGYASLLRVNNAGKSAVNLFAVVQPDTGGPALTGSLGSLGGGGGTVFSEAQIAAAVTGLDLANSGQRSTLQLIVSGNFGAVAASSFLVNPGGVVDNVGVHPN